jgi:hypothetical protein
MIDDHKNLFMKLLCLCIAILLTVSLHAQQPYNGVDSHLGNLFLLSNAQSRSISPENFNGAKGAAGKATTGTGAEAARELGQGWKISPSVEIKAHTTFTVAEMEGPGICPAYLDDTYRQLALFHPADLLG